MKTYRVRLDPYPDPKLWEAGWRVCLLFRFLGIYVTEYTRTI